MGREYLPGQTVNFRALGYPAWSGPHSWIVRGWNAMQPDFDNEAIATEFTSAEYGGIGLQLTYSGNVTSDGDPVAPFSFVITRPNRSTPLPSLLLSCVFDFPPFFHSWRFDWDSPVIPFPGFEWELLEPVIPGDQPFLEFAIPPAGW